MNVFVLNAAPAIREFAKSNGIEVGARGRLDKELVTAFLASDTKQAREIAKFQGVPVPAKGRLSEEHLDAIAATIG